MVVFFFKQKTAYEMRISDWSSYVCSSDLIGDQNVAVIRGKDGALRAFYNVCQHRAHELLRGRGRTPVITCPYHAWSYHLDGRLRTARGSQNVEGFNADEFCLKGIQVEEFGPFVFVNLDPDAAPLAQQSGGLLDELRHTVPALDTLTKFQTATFAVKANWKVRSEERRAGKRGDRKCRNGG